MKNQTEENAAPFTAPEIAEAFHLKTQGWTTSKGKPITAEQREDLIQNYLKDLHHHGIGEQKSK